MANSSGSLQSSWSWDQQNQQYYYIDQQTNEIVYQTGARVALTQPRTTQLGRAPQTLQQSPQYHNNSQQDYTHRPAPRSNPSSTSNASNASVSSYTQPNQPIQHRQLPYNSGRVGSSHQRTDSHQTNELTNAMVGLAVTPATAVSAQAQPYEPTAVPGVESDQGGIHYVHATDPVSEVQTTIATGPPNRITDPSLYEQGIRARRLLIGHPEVPQEHLFPGYEIKQSKFFEIGRVFFTLWTEPAGESRTLITAKEQSTAPPRHDPRGFTTVRYGELAYSKVRRFVVVRVAQNYCSALPIVSYGDQGVSKEGVNKSEHAIIYTGEHAPKPTRFEEPRPGERPMRPTPLRVVADDPKHPTMGRLTSMSRIDFGKVHTVQYNVKVRPFGRIHPKSKQNLLSQFYNVFGASAPLQDSAVDTTASASGPSRTSEASPPRAWAEQVQNRALQVYQGLIGQGYTEEQAFSQMLAGMLQQNPNLDRQRAARSLSDQLRAAAGSGAQATAGATQQKGTQK
ncbi:hypothetical protein KC333_g925 [Hortaea werneckii]|nr:hypothetical protein KC333_g925 [Hortaea werneckii]KAI7323522.1 hypothetical protein KC326_g1513 [Hortaea werneckii]